MKNLDGSDWNSLLPWYDSYPKPDPYFCNAIDNNQLFNGQCGQTRKYICAKGGNHCGSPSTIVMT